MTLEAKIAGQLCFSSGPAPHLRRNLTHRESIASAARRTRLRRRLAGDVACRQSTVCWPIPDDGGES
jgi:hypothetical protein